MRLRPEQWRAIKRSLASGARKRRLEMVFATIIFPVFEALLVNLYTSAVIQGTPSLAGPCLVAVVVLHVLLSLLLLFGEPETSGNALAGDVERDQELLAAKEELARREAAYRSFRSAFEMFNKQTCEILNWCENPFQTEFDPVVQQIRDHIQTNLGVTDGRYTIELYCDVGMVETCPNQKCGRSRIAEMEQVYFYSSQQIDAKSAAALGNRSPAAVARLKDVPTTYHINEQPDIYLDRGEPRNDVYFRRFATVPVKVVCSQKSMGVLVLTSMQEQTFSPNVLDSLQFLSTIATNFVNSYNMCLGRQAD